MIPIRLHLFFYLFLTLFSCHTAKKSAVALTHYKDWKSYQSKVFQEELKTVCKNWPEQWNKCPDGKSDWECIDSIDIQGDIMQLEKLKELYAPDTGKHFKMAVIHNFSYGFNQWYCETFLIRVNHAWRGKEIYKSGPYDSLAVLMDEKPVEKDVMFHQTDMTYYMKLKSGTFAYNGDIKIMTILNEKYEILYSHMALYP